MGATRDFTALGRLGHFTLEGKTVRTTFTKGAWLETDDLRID